MVLGKKLPWHTRDAAYTEVSSPLVADLVSIVGEYCEEPQAVATRSSYNVGVCALPTAANSFSDQLVAPQWVRGKTEKTMW